METSDQRRPAERQLQFSVTEAPALAAAWSYSAERYPQIRNAIAEALPEFIAVAAVSGSLARMEAHTASDIDLILVVDDRDRAVSDEQARTVFDNVWRQLDELGAVRPKSGGIFAECARWTQLTDVAARGRVDESLVSFGHRIQLLMDAQPLTASDRFTELQQELLDWYSETRLMNAFEEAGPFHWLWQDVQRYWRSLRSRTCWVNADDDAKAIALNVKLRSSRLMLVTSFLLTLQQAQSDGSSPDEVQKAVLDQLRRTPAERLFDDRTGICHWDRIWTWLRDTASCPPEQLPEAVGISLQELSGAVRERIFEAGNGRPASMWLF